MSYTSGFFDAMDLGGGNYDRKYSAAVFAHYFSLLVKNGVFPDPSTGMQVKASSSPDMHVSVQPGSGWVNGYYITIYDDGPEVLTVPTANPSLSRIDSVIMGLNYVDREIQLYIKSGAVSSSPSAVSLQRDNDLYEMELAQIAVGAGIASISQANITDMRQNTSRCGIVKGTIDQIDTTDLFAQYDDAFQTWFDDIQSQLSGDVATNLQNQINSLKTGKVNVSDKASTEQAQAGTDNTKWMTPALVKSEIYAFKATLNEALLGKSSEKLITPMAINAFIGTSNWRKIASFETATSGTWTAPDLLGSGNKYLIGFFIIGAGGGGAAVNTLNKEYFAHGGATGKTYAGVMEVTPGSTHPYVIGLGGESFDADYLSSKGGNSKGNPGGTSSFDGHTAEGGEGGGCTGRNLWEVGKGSMCSYGNSIECGNQFGGNLAVRATHSWAAWTYGFNLCIDMPHMCFNPFEWTYIMGVGGSICGDKTSTDGGRDPKTRKGGGYSRFNARAGNGSSPGSGGGGLLVESYSTDPNKKNYVTGAGADGAVYIYTLVR